MAQNSDEEEEDEWFSEQENEEEWSALELLEENISELDIHQEPKPMDKSIFLEQIEFFEEQIFEEESQLFEQQQIQFFEEQQIQFSIEQSLNELRLYEAFDVLKCQKIWNESYEFALLLLFEKCLDISFNYNVIHIIVVYSGNSLELPPKKIKTSFCEDKKTTREVYGGRQRKRKMCVTCNIEKWKNCFRTKEWRHKYPQCNKCISILGEDHLFF